MERSGDWLRQAQRDLQHAENSLKFADFEWVCFSSQQAAEKALKSVYEKDNLEARGHSILGLLQGLASYYKIPKEFFSYARILTRYYIETRYPNGFPEGAPCDFFDREMAEEAIDAAKKILEWCRDIILK